MRRLLPLAPLSLLLLVTMGVGPCDSKPLGGLDACTYEGKSYASGATFPAGDGCNTCSCQDGSVACTLVGCVDAGTDGSPGCRDSSGKATACPGDGGITDGGTLCFDVNGKQIACNTDGGGGGACIDGTKVYKLGTSFTCADGCNGCTCTSSGIVVTTNRACADASGDARADALPPSCYYVDGTGRACGFDAGVDCLYGNTFFPVGTSFPSADGCNTCSCTMNLTVACTAKACADAGAACVYAGKPYSTGATFPSIDGCNVCTCTAGGMISCTEKGCSDAGVSPDARADAATCFDANTGKVVPCPGADGGPMAVCMPGADQTCNDDLKVSALLGKCRADLTCDCGVHATNPMTGRCLTTTTMGCPYAGTTYPVGSKFMCTVDSSCMNAGLCYCASPGTTLPLCPEQPMAVCGFDAVYVYGKIGGLTAWTDQVTLTPPASYVLVRTASPGAGAASGSCGPALPACASSSIDVSDIMRDVADPTVQLLLSLSTMQTILLGTDPRPYDGQVFSFKKSDTAGFLVGSPCNGAAGCTEIPGAVFNLMADLQKLDAQQRQDPSCTALQK
jgi:hypothetical protein